MADPRPYVYGGLNLAFAALYAYVFLVLIPNRHGWAQLLLWSLPAVSVAMAAGMIARRWWGWLAGVIGAAALLLASFVLIGLLLASAAFLSGVYGAYGRGASAITLLSIAFVVQGVALVPALQLKFLLTRAGRRCFGLQPLWSP